MAEKGRSPKKGGRKGASKEVVPREGGVIQSAVESSDLRHLVTQMMSDPSMNAAVQQHLSSMVGTSSGYLEGLPAAVQRRIKALKNNQVEIVKVDAEFHRQVCALQASFEKKYQEVYDKRERIIAGSYEPTEEECQWKEDEDEEDVEDEGEEEEEEGEGGKDGDKKKAKVAKAGGEGKDDAAAESKKEAESEEKEDKSEAVKEDGAAKEDDVKGIPNFWLTAVRNAEVLEAMVKEWDEPALESLCDIRVVYPDEKGFDFILEFHFADNDYFTNKVLTKRYNIKCEMDSDSPFDFQGPEIVSAVGCEIQWNKGKNVTMKTVKKTQKHKSQGKTRVVTKTVKQDSFFQFFESLQDPEDVEDPEDEEEQEKRALDFTRGEFLRDTFIPRAVLYFTGEADQDEDFDDDDDDYVGEEGDSDEEADPDYKIPGDAGQPQECKQQ